MRWFASLAITAALLPASDDGYRFAPTDPPRAYLYEARQDSDWTSAGETLAFTSTLAWSFVVRCTASEATETTLSVTLLRVWATVRGPGSEHAVRAGNSSADAAEHRLDSETAGTERDPLLGHLAALAGTTLVLHVDPRRGVVTRVDGGDVIAKRIAERAPDATDPTAPSPLAAAAQTLYGSDQLAHLWSTMLARPDSGSLILAAPLSGSLSRAWAGDRFSVIAPTEPLAITIGRDAASVTGTLHDLAGGGGATLREGWPDECWSDLRATLRLTALTQPVEQRLRLRWKLSRLALGTPAQ